MYFISNSLAIAGSVVSLLTYLILTVVYRLYFHPNAKIPGPLLGKLTYWYEFYYDVVCRGQYIWKIRDLHKQYGPIIRISPMEVHISEPDFYDEIYTGATRKRDKWDFVCRSHGVPESAFGTSKHELHRSRRAALNPFFAKQKVRTLQPRIEEVVDSLLGRFEEFSASGKPLPLSDAFAALTYDVAFEYSFGRNEDHVKANDFAPSFRNVSQKGGNMVHFTKHFPWLHTLMNNIPLPIADRLDPDLAALVRVHKGIEKQVASIHSARAAGEKVSERTIFGELINNPSLPESEKAPYRLWQDGYVTVVAGTLTTADALTCAVWGALCNPSVLRKLKEELITALPNSNTPPPPFPQLENLPYLTAVINEALRISNGVSMRLSRIDPEKPVIFVDKASDRQYVIPAGTPMSMTGILIHFHEGLFPDPLTFKPERWLGDSDSVENRKKYLVPFTRGTRQCLGMNLAYAELYLTLALLFRRYGSKDVMMDGDRGYLDLYEFDYERDLKIVGDGALPLYSTESKGVRVVVKGVS